MNEYDFNITRVFDSPIVKQQIDIWASTWDIATVAILVGCVHLPAKFVIRYTLRYIRLRTLRNITQLSSGFAEHVTARFVAQCNEASFQRFGHLLLLTLTFLALYLATEASVFFWLTILTGVNAIGRATPCLGIVVAVASLGELVQLEELLPEREYNDLFVHYTGPPLVLMPAQ